MTDPPTFVQRADAIVGSEPSRFHIHEGRFARSLEFERRDELDKYIQRLEKGGSGSKQDGTWADNPSPYNCKHALKDKESNNALRLHYELRGNKNRPASISEPSPDVVEQEGRWFCIGMHDEASAHIRLSDQVEIVRFVCGTHTILSDYRVVKERRQELWKYWADGDARGEVFQKLDLPVIASWFRHVWETPLVYEGVDGEDDLELTAATLAGIKKEIVVLLDCSFAYEAPGPKSIVHRRSKRLLPDGGVEADDSKRPAARRQRRDRFSEASNDDTNDHASEGSGGGRRAEVEEGAAEAEEADEDSATTKLPILELGSLKQLLKSNQLAKVGALEIALIGANKDQPDSQTAVNERINELGGTALSAHGIMRDCYDCQIPLEFWDAKMRYKMLHDNKFREERRRWVRKIMTEQQRSDGHAEKKSRRPTKHSDRKATIAMIPRQVLRRTQDFGKEKLSALRPAMKARIKIGKINESSAKSKEKDLVKRTRALLEAKKSRMRRKPIDMDEQEDLALQQQSEYDKNWKSRDQQAEMADIHKMLKKEYWKKEVPLASLKVDLFRVIPSFESVEAWDATKGAIMKPSKDADGNILPPEQAERYDLGAHLALIKLIAKGKAENTLIDTDLSNLSEEDVLRVFVLPDQSTSKASVASKKVEKEKKLKAVFCQFGTKLSGRKRFTNERTYARIEAALERAEEEGSEEID